MKLRKNLFRKHETGNENGCFYCRETSENFHGVKTNKYRRSVIRYKKGPSIRYNGSKQPVIYNRLPCESSENLYKEKFSKIYFRFTSSSFTFIFHICTDLKIRLTFALITFPNNQDFRKFLNLIKVLKLKRRDTEVYIINIEKIIISKKFFDIFTKCKLQKFLYRKFTPRRF